MKFTATVKITPSQEKNRKTISKNKQTCKRDIKVRSRKLLISLRTESVLGHTLNYISERLLEVLFVCFICRGTRRPSLVRLSDSLTFLRV